MYIVPVILKARQTVNLKKPQMRKHTMGTPMSKNYENRNQILKQKNHPEIMFDFEMVLSSSPKTPLISPVSNKAREVARNQQSYPFPLT